MKRQRILGGAALIAFAPFGVAHAQNAGAEVPQAGAETPEAAAAATQPDQGKRGLQEIVVVAQRRSENLQKVPISVTVVTGAQIKDLKVTTNEDLAALTPGLNFVHATNNSLPFLRGVGFLSGTPGNEPGVAFYVDGVYFPSPVTSVHTFTQNIDHVEVLKGPQGTLYGRNSAGGVIQMITKDPSSNPVADFDVGYARFNAPSAGLYASTGLTDALAGDISVYYSKQNDGWGKNVVTGRDTYLSREFSVRSKSVWKPNESLKFTLVGDYANVRNDQGSLTTNLLPGTFSSTGKSGVPGFWDTQQGPTFNGKQVSPFGVTRQGGVSFKAEADTSFMRFVSLTAYRAYSGNLYVDNDATTDNISGATTRMEGRTFTQEFQLQSLPSSKLKWVAGLFLFDDWEGVAPLQFLPAYTQVFGHQKVWSYAPFAQITYPIFHNTNVTAGVRYTDDKKKQVDTYILSANNVLLSGPFHGHADAAKFTYSASIDHSFSDRVMAYISTSRGFRSGNFNNLNPAARATKPQTVDAYELGLKTETADRRLRFDVALFNYKLSDIVVQTIGANGVPAQINAASGRSRGVDVDITASPTDNLNVTLAGEYLDAKFTNFHNAVFYYPCSGSPINPTCASNAVVGGAKAGYYIGVGDATGNPLPNTEKFSATASARYTVPLNSGTIEILPVLAYHSGIYYDAQRFVKQKDYATINAAIQWTAENRRLSVEVWAKNLTNVHTYSYTALQTFGIVYSAGAPLTFGVDAKLHFRG